ncbi:glucokinase [Gloeobacter kilaueensis]|uniref:Glucokinase n=1 Tax=Gloeobacter kilaueensis (strain ATCC BAA-2537 / CCAP 1431/1 / ULC 316 / JS1) TaxID=1183438 RepID=U5QJF7_GLOK1|nr:glucokinase [Gloeobacter kilaueensis]AGY59122.1 glucokinase [Gloeobacter kilaueensis JS1]
MILAGDIGGTNVRLALFEDRGDHLETLAEQSFLTHAYAGLEEIVALFLDRQGHKKVDQASFGVAGPVIDGQVHATNLPWLIEASTLQSALDLMDVGLINDLEANAYGIALLRPSDLVVVNAGVPGATGNAAIISAGTGLGEAGLYWDGHRHRPFATEGGHTDFAPAGELQVELLQYLTAEYGRVSWERVLSGPGLYNLYRFLRDTGRGKESAATQQQLRQAEDLPSVIGRSALSGNDPLSEQALDLFVALYGAEAGNLALKIMARGGLYVGGGIAPKIVAKLRTPAFLQAFVAKGRLQPLLEAMPLSIILNDRTALLGAARYALLAGEQP